MDVAICWFRRDLRLADNSALDEALRSCRRVVPAVLIPENSELPSLGAAGQRWRSESLAALDASLRARGSCLVSRAGGVGALVRLAQECGARDVWCQRDHGPAGLAEESRARDHLAAAGMTLHVTGGQYLVDPGDLLNSSGEPYRVFTPFWKAWRRALRPISPVGAPEMIPSPTVMPASAGMIVPDRSGPDVRRWWEPGESAALARLELFAASGLARYDDLHDIPAEDGTSALSPRLAWGELSPAQVASAALDAGSDAEPFLRQLAWREFSAHVLHHFPETVSAPWRREFEAFPWGCDAESAERWRRGMTGFPLVDAGMRQLLATGWMHNRVRMVVASFLAKDLLCDWRDGERFFAERLVDFDHAVNVFNWQWSAGCGADAAPWFRIFNPALQGRRFDPQGAYVREWVPELAKLDARWIHEPHKAPARELDRAGLELGRDYPIPMIDHAEARKRALAAYSGLS